MNGDHVRELIFDHFSLRIRPRDERRMRTHLSECAECRAHYERHLALAALDPDAPSVRERLAVGLGLRRRHVPLSGRIALAMGATAMAALAVWVVGKPSDRTVALDERSTPGFVARGGPDRADNGFTIFRAGAHNGDALVPVGDDETVGPDDELAFSYRNPQGKPYLLIFAVEAPVQKVVDQGAGIRWYHPAWQDPAMNPTAVAIRHGSGPVILPEAVSHDFQGQSEEAHVFAVFTDVPLTVQEVEAAVTRDAAGKPGLDLPRGDTLIFVRKLRLSRR